MGDPARFIRLSSREGCYWIEELFVKPKFRGQGIGKALVKRVEEEVKKHDDALYLYVLPQDKDAIAFWKKMGYRIVNTIELMKDLSDEKVPLRTIEILGRSSRYSSGAGRNIQGKSLNS
ncbi:GNAT family N-acetyltransferase [Pyrococcus kukulkanii]|uniref:GNAT family N-acetyltransferase n=1 Tax=Pyrococcus kukulkanii TaxID=1609559 RepID=UPI003562EAD6